MRVFVVSVSLSSPRLLSRPFHRHVLIVLVMMLGALHFLQRLGCLRYGMCFGILRTVSEFSIRVRFSVANFDQLHTDVDMRPHFGPYGSSIITCLLLESQRMRVPISLFTFISFNSP